MSNRIPSHIANNMIDTAKIEAAVTALERATLSQLKNILNDGDDAVTVRRRDQLHRILKRSQDVRRAYRELFAREIDHRDKMTESGLYAPNVDVFFHDAVKA